MADAEMDPDPIPPDDPTAVERAIDEIDRESARVGVDWRLVARALRESESDDLFPDVHESGGEPVVGLDTRVLLPILRALPDGAGTEAFLRALETTTE